LQKNINQITFYFVEEGPGSGSEDIKKGYNFNCLDSILIPTLFTYLIKNYHNSHLKPHTLTL